MMDQGFDPNVLVGPDGKPIQKLTGPDGKPINDYVTPMPG